MAAKISENDKDIKDMVKKPTKELMKLALDWSLPNGEVAPDIVLKTIFFTKRGQGVCEASQPLKGKNSDGTSGGVGEHFKWTVFSQGAF